MELISGVQVWEHWNKSQSFQLSAREEMQPCVKKRNRVFKIRVGLGGPCGTEKNFPVTVPTTKAGWNWSRTRLATVCSQMPGLVG